MLADKINNIHKKFFLNEFSFNESKFTPPGGTKVELSDYFIWLETSAILIQAKARDTNANMDDESLINWFNNKVKKKAVKQVRGTINYISENESISIENEKGHTFSIRGEEIEKYHKIVIYDCDRQLPDEIKFIKFHKSNKCGFIHIFNIYSYSWMCQILKTPVEIIEYLFFREKYLSVLSKACFLREKSIVGRFLLSDKVPDPKFDIGIAHFSGYVDNLVEDLENWDLSYLMNLISTDRYFEEEPNKKTDYYSFLLELLWLNRWELKHLKERLNRVIESVKKDEFIMPYRMISLKRNCGFLISPIQKELFEHRINGLKNLTMAAKYEKRLERCFGISVSRSEDIFFFDYAYFHFPWRQDARLEKELNKTIHLEN